MKADVSKEDAIDKFMELTMYLTKSLFALAEKHTVLPTIAIAGAVSAICIPLFKERY